MAFKATNIASHSAYEEKSKKELLKLKSDAGTVKQFWFYDEVDLGGNTAPIFLFADVEDSVLRSLKSKAKSRASGTFFLEGDTLNISLVKGKMPAPKVKPLFQRLKVKFKLVSADRGPDSDGDSEEERAFFARLNPVTDRYDSLRPKLTDDRANKADEALGKISALATQGKFDEAMLQVKAFDRALDDLAETTDGALGTNVVEIKKRADALATKFDGIKAALPDDERTALRKMFGAFQDAHDNSGDPERMRRALFDLVAAMKEAEKNAGTPRTKLQAAAKTVLAKIKEQQANLTPKDLQRVNDLVTELKTALSSGDQQDGARVLGLLQQTLKEVLTDTGARSMDGGDAAAAQRNLRAAVNVFDEIKGDIEDEARKQLRIAFGRAGDDIKAGKFAEADEVTKAITERLTELKKSLSDNTAQSTDELLSDADARQLVVLKRRAAELQQRFAKARGRMDSGVASGIEVELKKIAKELGKSSVGDCAKRLDKVEKDLRASARSTLRAAEEQEEQAQKALESAATPEEIALGAEIRSLSEDIETVFGSSERMRAQMGLIRRELADPTTSGIAAIPLLVELDGLTDDLEQAQKDLAKHRKELNEKVEELKQLNLQKHPALVQTLKSALSRYTAAEEALGGLDTTKSRAEIEDLVGKMAIATEWREKQIKAGGGHGSSRHGAQTGLERQARRAATPSSVTPEQTDNKGGAAMILDWNEVQITYKEEDGKRVIDNRKVVASKVAGVLTAGGPNTSKGSMWATPVLEKLAYDTALAYANKMRKYTRYIKPNNTTKPFEKFTCFIEAPKGQPGWGFSVENTGPQVSEADAEKILREFEEGKLTHDQMFAKFNSELVGKGGSAEYIKYATVCFKRANGGDPWELLTMFPDDRRNAQSWECQKGWQPNGLRFDEGHGTAQYALNNNVMP